MTEKKKSKLKTLDDRIKTLDRVLKIVKDNAKKQGWSLRFKDYEKDLDNGRPR